MPSDTHNQAGRFPPPPPPQQRWYVSVDGTPCGPFSAPEIRAMATDGRLQPNDYVILEGAREWKFAEDDAVISRFFSGPKLVALGHTDLRHGRKLSGVFLWSVLPLLLLLGWICWPYYSVYTLIKGVRSGDVALLESAIDWEAVRKGIKADINANMLKDGLGTMSSNPDAATALGTGLAVMLAPSIVNQTVDSFVTPNALAAFVRQPKQANPNASAPLVEAAKGVSEMNFDFVRHAFFAGGPFTFSVVLASPKVSEAEGLNLVFKWNGTWRLTRIYAPNSLFDTQTIAGASDKEISKKKENTNQFLNSPPQVKNNVVVSLSDADVTELRRKLAKCWTPVAGSEKIKPIVIRVLLRRDGYLAGEPTIQNIDTNPIFAASAASALKAIRSCQPIILPAEKYEAWKDMEVKFDPHE